MVTIIVSSLTFVSATESWDEIFFKFEGASYLLRPFQESFFSVLYPFTEKELNELVADSVMSLRTRDCGSRFCASML